MTDTVGVAILGGAQNWQVFQQDDQGAADITLQGRWQTQNPFKHAQVIVRLMGEADMQPVGRGFDWRPAEVCGPDGTWSATLCGVLRGGLYRIETALQLDGCPVEWAQRGDAVHHVGVGDIWVLAGQSNSAGYGKAPAFDPPELGLHMFHACGEWRLAAHPLSDSTNTRYPANREGANGSHSPYLAFARRLKNALGYPIGLIPAALGGSAMSAWTRGIDGVLFENMLSYLRDAGVTRCRGMAWYQGESDTGPEQRAVYAARFREMVEDFRRCVNNPRAAVITAQLNRFTGEATASGVHEGWEAMREIQRQIPRQLADVLVIGTLDLGLSDGIHNDSSANLRIGERMANAALGAVYGRDVKWRHPEPRAARLAAADAVEVCFDHVDTRLHFENTILELFPFAVRDEAGVVPVRSWAMKDRATIRIELGRPVRGHATVIGAPAAYPPSVLPFDICGYLPMLGFTVAVE